MTSRATQSLNDGTFFATLKHAEFTEEQLYSTLRELAERVAKMPRFEQVSQFLDAAADEAQSLCAPSGDVDDDPKHTRHEEVRLELVRGVS